MSREADNWFDSLYDDEDRNQLLDVPAWMQARPGYGQNIGHMERKAYVGNIHDGRVNIPGLTKSSRIISTKVPPLYSPEHDAGTSYTLLEWADDIKDWCIICEVDAYKQGKLVQLAIDGTAKIVSKYLTEQALMHGEIQDWGDGTGRQHRTGVELVIKTAFMIYPPNPQVIQLKAIRKWQRFRRLDRENTQSMLARMKVVLHEAAIDGNYEVTQIQLAEKLVQLFNLSAKQYAEYMKPFGGQLPGTPEGVALFEAELARDFTLEESGRAGAVETPLTVIKQSGHFSGVANTRPAPQGQLALSPAYPIHFMQPSSPAAHQSTWQPLPLTGASSHQAQAYPASQPSLNLQHAGNYPDSDDD